MRKVLKNVVSLAVLPSARYDLMPFIPLEQSPWVSAWIGFFTMLFPLGLFSSATAPIHLPLAVACTVPYFLLSLPLMALHHILCPDSLCLMPVFFLMLVMLKLAARPASQAFLGLQESRRWLPLQLPASQGPQLQRFHPTPTQGCSCREAAHCSDPSFHLTTPVSISQQCQDSKQNVSLSVPQFKNHLSASSCYPAAHKLLKQLI